MTVKGKSDMGKRNAMCDDYDFTLCVEKPWNPAEPLKIQGFYIEWNLKLDGGLTEPPDIVSLSTGEVLIKVGRYASPGERWRYRIATVAMVRNNVCRPADMEGHPV